VSGIILVAAALGLSNFAAAIGIGLSGVDRQLRIRIAIIFGFFEAAMPLLGLLVGHRVAGSIGSAASYLGGGLLIATGIYAFVQARLAASEVAGPTNTGKLILTGAALSIDNLVCRRFPKLPRGDQRNSPVDGPVSCLNRDYSLTLVTPFRSPSVRARWERIR